jgi:peptidoglycan/LPS O-acetylase OafA/YrhL
MHFTDNTSVPSKREHDSGVDQIRLKVRLPTRKPPGSFSLRRITSGGRYIAQIDGLRFVAIASVVLYHIPWVLHDNLGIQFPQGLAWAPVLKGSYGVFLFFAISGFILGLPFAQHELADGRPVCLKQYFTRRLTRLEPPYILAVLLYFILKVRVAHAYTFHSLFPHLLATLSYTHNFVYGTRSLVSGVTWTLELEVQFYILMPLLALVYRVKSHQLRRTSVLGMMFLLALCTQLWPNSFICQRTVLGVLPFFLAGILLADLVAAGSLDWFGAPSMQSNRAGRQLLLDAVALPCWCTVFLLSKSFVMFLLPPILLITYVAALRGLFFSKIFSNPLLAISGGMCYSIYLYHYAVLVAVLGNLSSLKGIPGPQAFLAGAVVGVPAVALISVVFFVLVERPCMERDWPRKLERNVSVLLSRDGVRGCQ